MGVCYKMSREAYKKIAYVTYGKKKGKYLGKKEVLKILNDTAGLMKPIVEIELV